MSLPAGTRLGVYDIVSPLGTGGMGEVYRARDSKLGRDVAIKVLPSSFAADSERVARFRREAQVLAALNHPHIAAIYGIDDGGPTPFLVMELVEGPTLDQLIQGQGVVESGQAQASSSQRAHGAAVRAGRTRRGLPIDDVLSIARQIADALEAAHEKGIIHRDLKPANIALAADGRVKVLDFGLAKPADAGRRPGVTASPTITSPALLTGVGVLLGTAAYMSPEQAKGRAADKRSDVWAFGCVLYEMLTGRRAFEGDDVTDTLAAIVRGEPDWQALPADVPESVRRLLRGCLTKDRLARISDLAVARFLLSDISTSSPIAVTGSSGRSRRLTTAAALLGGVAIGAAGAAAVAWMQLREPRLDAETPVRFSIAPTGPQALAMYGGDRNIDISPDGLLIAYRGADPSDISQTRLFVRSLANLDTRPLTEVGDVHGPFFSPDGAWIGFFSSGELKKVPVGGGVPTTICRIKGTPRGASWGSDDTIVFAAGEHLGLMSVSAAGGDPQVLVEGSRDGIATQPSILPGSATVVFTLVSTPERTQIIEFDRRTRRTVTLLRGFYSASYAAGALWLVAPDGSLRAAAFDPRRLALHSNPETVATAIMRTPLNTGNFAVSDTGTLVYVPGTSQAVTPLRSLVWVDRRGRESAIDLPRRAYGDVRISPDGRQIALGIRDDQRDVWIADLARLTLTRLTFTPNNDQLPVWTPDGRRIVWSSQGNAAMPTPTLFIQAADGTGPPTLLFGSGNPLFPTSISPDGAHVIAWENNPGSGQDIIVVDVPGAGRAQTATGRSILHTNAAEMDAEISPDGRWLAYQSNEGTRTDVYVRPFPNVGDGRWQMSTDGGTRPAWARNGRELFYIDGDGLLTSVSIDTSSSTFKAGTPSRVLATRYYAGTTSLGLDSRGYDVSPDGERFLMLKDVAPASGTPTVFTMVVSLHAVPDFNKRPAK